MMRTWEERPLRLSEMFNTSQLQFACLPQEVKENFHIYSSCTLSSCIALVVVSQNATSLLKTPSFSVTSSRLLSSMSLPPPRLLSSMSDIEERRRDSMAEKLAVYKREMANCRSTARVTREEEARLDEIYNRSGRKAMNPNSSMKL